MHQPKRFGQYLMTALMLAAILSSCNLTNQINQNNAVKATLAALGATQTALAGAVSAPQNTAPAAVTEAPAAATATPETPAATPTNTVPPPIVHALTPGEPGGTVGYMNDTNDMPGSAAAPNKAVEGDIYGDNLLERPFTQNMVYRPDVDITRSDLTLDGNFFYVTIALRDVDPLTKTLHATYAVELDINRDGRGDYLIWAMPADGNTPYPTAWTTEHVLAFQDTNHDVGKYTAMMADAPGAPGNGYDTKIFSGSDRLGDPDGAWVRLGSDGTHIQIAFKKSLVGNPDSFMWGTYADDGLKALDTLDYNDQLTIAQAGSPLAGSNYPLKALYLVDNTCRWKYGFTPTGNEIGLCPTGKAQPTLVPIKPVITLPPPAICLPVTITASFSDGSHYDGSWSSAITACLNGGSCAHPNSGGSVTWSGLGPGTYTVSASSTAYGVSPKNHIFSIDCGKITTVDFTVGIP